MSRVCAVIRHVHFEDLGSFAGPIAKAGYDIRYLEAAVDDLTAAREADLTVLLGGPIGVYEDDVYPFLKEEVRIAAERLTSGRPLMGICLGAQIIARAGGGRVYPGENGKEIGWAPLRLTPAGAGSVIAPLGEEGGHMLHWHGDTFDLPPGVTLLASTDRYPNQIYTIAGHVLAFQCHPELDPAKIEHWLIGHAHEIAATEGIDPVTIRKDTARHGAGLVHRGQQVITQWLENLPIVTDHR